MLSYSHFCKPSMAKISFLVFWANLEVIFRGEGVKMRQNPWNLIMRKFSLLSESKIGFPVAQTVVELLTIFYTLPPKVDFSIFRIIKANYARTRFFPNMPFSGKVKKPLVLPFWAFSAKSHDSIFLKMPKTIKNGHF